MWFPKLLKLPMPNQFGHEVVVYNGQIALSAVEGAQLLALGGEHSTHYRLGDLMNQASDVEVVRGLKGTTLSKEKVYTLKDCIVINAPKVFSQCVIEPDPLLASLGWATPILAENVPKPEVEQPSQLLERGFDPSDECIHFVGWVNWRLSPTIIDEWEKFQDVQIKVCMYTSFLLQDMHVDAPLPKRSNPKRANWAKK